MKKKPLIIIGLIIIAILIAGFVLPSLEGVKFVWIYECQRGDETHNIPDVYAWYAQSFIAPDIVPPSTSSRLVMVGLWYESVSGCPITTITKSGISQTLTTNTAEWLSMPFIGSGTGEGDFVQCPVFGLDGKNGCLLQPGEQYYFIWETLNHGGVCQRIYKSSYDCDGVGFYKTGDGATDWGDVGFDFAYKFAYLESWLYDLTVKTAQPNCNVRIVGTGYIGSSGYAGEITFPNLPEGIYQVEVSKIGYNSKAEAVNLDSSKTITITLEEGTGPTYEFRVETNPLDCKVTLGSEYQYTTNGPVTFTDLFEGTYALLVEKDGYNSYQTYISVPSETSQSIILNPAGNAFAVTIYVLDTSGNFIDKAKVTLSGITKLTNDYGMVDFLLEEEKDYLIEVEKSGFNSLSETYSITKSTGGLTLVLEGSFFSFDIDWFSLIIPAIIILIFIAIAIMIPHNGMRAILLALGFIVAFLIYYLM